MYLRDNYHLWGWIREKDVKRRTGCFLIPKKEGGPRLRKILTCIDANNAMKEPRKTVLPGPWNISKVRFRKKTILDDRERGGDVLLLTRLPDLVLGVFCPSPRSSRRSSAFQRAGRVYLPGLGRDFSEGRRGHTCLATFPNGLHMVSRIGH